MSLIDFTVVSTKPVAICSGQSCKDFWVWLTYRSTNLMSGNGRLEGPQPKWSGKQKLSCGKRLGKPWRRTFGRPQKVSGKPQNYQGSGVHTQGSRGGDVCSRSSRGGSARSRFPWGSGVRSQGFWGGGSHSRSSGSGSAAHYPPEAACSPTVPLRQQCLLTRL